MKEYNQALVQKLKEKNSELEKAQAELTRINQELEQRVRDRTAQLEAANAELEAFNHSVSHDLRTPLTEVYAYAQLVLERQSNRATAEITDFLQKILTAARRMESLIKELMKLSKVKQGELRRRPFQLGTAAQSIAERLQAGEPQRSAEFHIPPTLVVEADMELLSIALENLLSNAWKFTGKRPRAKIELGEIRQGGQTVYFVRDNGVGFEMDYAQRLFHPFERLHNKTDYPGTGIGLTIVQRIITRHQGRIWAEAKVNEGATFYFTLGQ
jgi:light-regulated signal transduction histidine kinase (bacteriophytochrome)